MTTNKKLAIAVVALSLALVCAIGGTLAFLVATSNTVTNTFTYGGISITLTETKGTLSGEVREFGKVVPGATIEKDPTVSVDANSENCHVYAKVVNNVVLDGKTIVTCNIDTDNWTLIGNKTEDDGSVVSLYKYKSIVQKSDDDTALSKVFETVTFSTGFELEDVAKLDAIKDDIVITAYAHQSDYITVEEANDAAITWAGVTLIPNTKH